MRKKKRLDDKIVISRKKIDFFLLGLQIRKGEKKLAVSMKEKAKKKFFFVALNGNIKEGFFHANFAEFSFGLERRKGKRTKFYLQFPNQQRTLNKHPTEL